MVVSEQLLMSSLWVCPDCRRVGRRGSVRPGLANPGGLDPNGECTHRPGGMPVAISSWTCPECGQIGELVESRETTVEVVEAGAVAEVRRNPVFLSNRDEEIRPAHILIPLGLLALCLEIIALWNRFGN